MSDNYDSLVNANNIENSNGDGTGVSNFFKQTPNTHDNSDRVIGSNVSVNAGAGDNNLSNSALNAYVNSTGPSTSRSESSASEVLKKGVEGIEYTAYDTQADSDDTPENARSNYKNFMGEIKQGIFCDVIFRLNQILYGFNSGLKRGISSSKSLVGDIGSLLSGKTKGEPSKGSVGSITINGDKQGIWAYQGVGAYFNKLVEKASDAPGEDVRYNQYLTMKNLGLVLNSLGKKGTVGLNDDATNKQKAEFNNVQAEFDNENEAGEFIIKIVEKIASYGWYLTILEQELNKDPKDRESNLRNVESKNDSSLKECQNLINVASATVNQIYKLAAVNDNSRGDILPVTQNIKVDLDSESGPALFSSANTTDLQTGSYASAVTDIKNAVKMAVNPPQDVTNNNQIIIESNSPSHSTSSPPPGSPSFSDSKKDIENSWDNWGEIFADPFFVPFIGIVPKFRRAFLSERMADGKVKMDLTGVIYRSNDKNAIKAEENKKLENPNILKSVLRDKEVLPSAIDFLVTSYKEAANLGFSNVIKGYLATDINKDYNEEIKALDNPAEFLDNIGTAGLLGENEDENVLPEKLKTLKARKVELVKNFDISTIGDQSSIEGALKKFTLDSYEVQKQIAQCEYALAEGPDQKQEVIKGLKNFLTDDFNANDIEMLKESLKDKRESNYKNVGANAKSIAEADTYTGENKNIQEAKATQVYVNMPALLISQMAPQIISMVEKNSEAKKAQENSKGGYTNLGKSGTTQNKYNIDLTKDDATGTKKSNKKTKKSASQVINGIIEKGTMASNILKMLIPTASSFVDTLYTANKIDDAQKMLKDGLISLDDYNKIVEGIQGKSNIIKKALNISGYVNDVLSIGSDIMDVVNSAGTIGKMNKSLKTSHVRTLKASKDFRARFNDNNFYHKKIKNNKDNRKEVMDRLSQYSASKRDRAVYHNEDIGLNAFIQHIKRGSAKDYAKYMAGLSANTTTTRFNRNIKVANKLEQVLDIVANTKDIAEKVSGKSFEVGGKAVEKGTDVFKLILNKTVGRYRAASPEYIARRNTMGHILSLPNFAVDEEAKAFLSSRGEKTISSGKLKSLTEHAKAYSLLQALDLDIPGFVSACKNLGNNKQATKPVDGAAAWLTYIGDNSTSTAYACQKGDVLDIILGGKSSSTIEKSYEENYIKSEKKNGHKQFLYKYNNVFMKRRNFMAKIAPEVAILRTKRLKYQIKSENLSDNDPIKNKLKAKIEEVDKKLEEIVNKIRSYDNELKSIQNKMIKNTYGTEVGATENAFPQVDEDPWESALGLDFGVYYNKKGKATKQYEKLTSARQAAKAANVTEGFIELDNISQAPTSKNRAQKKQG